jgi:methionyl-tRNA formyltransferase
MRLEAGLDTGPVFACARTAIAPRETAGELRVRLVHLGTELLIEQLPGLRTAVPNEQSGEPTYADKLNVEEFRLDPGRPSFELARVVRAGNPRPGAWFVVNDRRVKVWRAHDDPNALEQVAMGEISANAVLGCASGALVLDEVQPEGKRVMDGSAWRAGVRGDVRVAGS